MFIALHAIPAEIIGSWNDHLPICRLWSSKLPYLKEGFRGHLRIWFHPRRRQVKLYRNLARQGPTIHDGLTFASLLACDFTGKPLNYVTVVIHGWLVVWNMNFVFHIRDNPSHWRTHIFQDGSNHQPDGDFAFQEKPWNTSKDRNWSMKQPTILTNHHLCWTNVSFLWLAAAATRSFEVESHLVKFSSIWDCWSEMMWIEGTGSNQLPPMSERDWNREHSEFQSSFNG